MLYNRNELIISLIVLTGLMIMPRAYSGPFRIQVTSYGTSNPTIRAEIDAAYQQIENEINQDLPNADSATYGIGMSNGTLLCAKGLGVDHASNFDTFVSGFSVGLGADAGTTSIGDVVAGDVDANQLKGFGVSTGFMAGINVARFAENSRENKLLERFNLYFHLMKFNIDSFAPGANGFIFDLESTTAGFMGQYQWVRPKTLAALIQ